MNTSTLATWIHWLNTPARLFRLVLFVLLIIYPFVFTQPYLQRLMILIFLYAMLGQSWNILGGYAGQVSLGHAMFFGIGAYTSTLLLVKVGITPWIGMLAGGLAAVALSQIIGYPCFRLKGHYFVIATIVVAEIVQIAFINWPWAGGANGITFPILPPTWVNFAFYLTKIPYYYVSLALLASVLLTSFLIERSKAGFCFRAIREDPDAARGLGINIFRYKMMAMAVSAFFTGIGGVFYAQFTQFIDPDSVLPFMLSTLLMLIPVLGGIGLLWGAVVGAFILIPLSEFTRIYLSNVGSALDLLVYGLLIVLVAVFEPRGLLALTSRFRNRG